MASSADRELGEVVADLFDRRGDFVDAGKGRSLPAPIEEPVYGGFVAFDEDFHSSVREVFREPGQVEFPGPACRVRPVKDTLDSSTYVYVQTFFL